MSSDFLSLFGPTLIWSDIGAATDSDGVPSVDPNLDFMRARPGSHAIFLPNN